MDIRNGLFIDITGLSETHPNDLPGVWACKNNHRYNTTDLYPMRDTMFEGVVAKVPYAYDYILTEEYGATALIFMEWEDHRWDPIVKEWLPKSEEVLAEESKEAIAAFRERKAQMKEEEAAKERKRVEEKQRKETEKALKEKEEAEKARKEKEEAEKQAETQRLEVQQSLMKEKDEVKEEKPSNETNGWG
ncbi:MAG: hypothetical protein Q9224_007500 [Gallowayella concinna]